MALLLASLYECNVCSIELKSRLWLIIKRGKMIEIMA